MPSELELLQEAERLFAAEPKLIELAGERAVFVGDTHGDLEASEKVISRYLKPGTKLVFLGDYVDRGPESRENLLYLLEQKLAHPADLFLLMGNHEGWKFAQFTPADFWLSLSAEEERLYASAVAALPLVATTTNGVIALHGALPDVPSLEEINGIEPGSEAWREIAWGDWADLPGDSLGWLWSRPRFGRDHFERLMRRFRKSLLIRSHQPDAPEQLFEGRCLTIFTSSAYGSLREAREVAIVPLETEVHSAGDIQLARV
ncbi:MAG: serine/threonine protein phosphatase [Candidatus Acetothermia bacterium]|jgi:predicted MPP superfamily phosphohydrolase|nr:serine/threonine protein phosphatase [Candidatus Acetothermia bacterium]MDH7504603.1 metallophosphoesterase family protein [Candidatus Acetothermia bacterium]